MEAKLEEVVCKRKHQPTAEEPRLPECESCLGLGVFPQNGLDPQPCPNYVRYIRKISREELPDTIKEEGFLYFH